MGRDQRWPTRPFLFIRTLQLLVGICFCLITGYISNWICYFYALAVSLFSVFYVLMNLWCFFTERLDPTPILYFDFILVFLWILVTIMIGILDSDDYFSFTLAAVAALEMMLFVPTTTIAAVVMYQTRGYWCDEVMVEQTIDLESAAGPQDPRIPETGAGVEARGDVPAHFQEVSATQ
ncbi:hypothetical protein Q9L58_006839 [Maublancomyces gigas]|uniref:MARVEL domain-containing protein n=1 Tax=Discina gigas TaxID=1032678 RepID=A0ABR3GE29_9PEZI